jgi:NAD(P)-dependent dehydrogenase (short-subunit alcohol dehydrogenase family)
MPPPRGQWNVLEGPADYDMTSVIHEDTYPAIDSSKADFSGKAVFISGATRGLGRAMGVSFAKAGASMLALGGRSDFSATIKEIKEVVAGLGKPMPKILPLTFDVCDRESVDEAAAKVKEEFGHIDIVINNAGIINEPVPIGDSDPDVWWRVLQVNLKGSYLVTRAFLPLLLDGSDKTIVTVSSVAAHVRVTGYSPYMVSKLALLRLTESISGEYGDKGILSYCIHPGNVPTDIVGGLDGVPPGMGHSESICVEVLMKSPLYLLITLSLCRDPAIKRRLPGLFNIGEAGLAGWPVP